MKPKYVTTQMKALVVFMLSLNRVLVLVNFMFNGKEPALKLSPVGRG